MKKIFLTGATGVMGSHGLKELTSFPGQYEVTVLARDNKINRKKLAQFIKKGVKVIWGDLLDRKAVADGVADADIVLHVGGMVSPSADWFPEKTIKTNVGAMSNIIEAALPRKNDVKIVYIGSVSQYGNREVPDHWGQCGDPLTPAFFDAYAYSKTEAERMLIDSELKWWVSLRQTGILHSGLLMNASDPIAFHVPIRGVLEWVTADDSGRLLERVCRDEVPDTFWNKCYNIGGGAFYRMTNYEFECELLKAMGCPPPEKIFDTNWFATKNFHGFWFSDSDDLEEILHFRKGDSPQEYFMQMKKELPWYFSLAPIAPAIALKVFMGKVAKTPKLGPRWWIENDIQDRIVASWGSRQAWEAIPDWEDMDLSRPSDVNPGSSVSAEVSDLEKDNNIETFICDCCGRKYKMKVRTRTAGHGCPHCLKSRVNLSSIK
ncbi:MAG: NAD-dependent epimerase/dehydratase family protein [Muribaculaceae bacterium]|nr:NAD-dependent epimerase/dehydratase family protein [Muribaculaceae bacterium]